MLAYYSAINKRDLDAAMALWARPLRAPQRRALEELLSAFPDYAIRIADAIGQRDRVVVRQIETGTHGGDPGSNFAGGLLHGVRPTGKTFEVQSLHVYRVTGGWVAEHWQVRDDVRLLVQLGVIEPAERSRSAPSAPS